MGVVSTPCVPGVLEDDELDDELDELEPVAGACCACSAGASITPPTSNATAAITQPRSAFGMRSVAIGMQREAIGMVRGAIVRSRGAIR
jgi:hypothetical protein